MKESADNTEMDAEGSVVSDPLENAATALAIHESRNAGWPVYTVSPRGTTPSGRLLYLHGGGHISEITPMHWNLIARVVLMSGWEAVIPEFPVAPTATYREVYPFLRAIYDNQIFGENRETAIVGDSSGGTLALALLESLPSARRPGQTILLSPWLDAVLDNPAIGAIEKLDRIGSRAQLRRFAKLFAGDADLAAPEISPLRGDLTGLGRVTIFAGTHDILTPDTRRFKQLAGAGTDVILHEYAGKPHAWMLLSEPDSVAIAREVSRVLLSNEEQPGRSN